ncbi:GNAT family N-acetyltransferase [Candidatus Xianfuyuplasma coldseepsis]|uniref:GNAT family N-acetyltransferase n=1 Tax=Candidatus Xianfuyuplasma coldseepsis TaxID=2782163 RepID=A0A7L7KS59_9MOLU|nr:GNAT family N-acetyltransferase [Xianfuyuplasma coldseepsis]QMS85573.1 GNAT family N-acetyltransferase [Xianfuyuplasma coldseepsis]
MDLTTLQSKRLTFQPFNAHDFEDLYRILSNQQTCQYLPGGKPYTEEQVHKWLNYFINSFSIDKRHVVYAIRLHNDLRIIGYCGCNFVPEFNTNEIKYILHPDYFGYGYATEAALMMKQVASTFDFTTLVGLADIRNIASQRVLEKIGYIYQKTIDIWGETMKYYELPIQKNE